MIRAVLTGLLVTGAMLALLVVGVHYGHDTGRQDALEAQRFHDAFLQRDVGEIYSRCAPGPRECVWWRCIERKDPMGPCSSWEEQFTGACVPCAEDATP